MKCSAFKWALRLLKGSLNNCQGRPKTNEVIHNPNYETNDNNESRPERLAYQAFGNESTLFVRFNYY